jgi:hypothetical protein
MAAYQGTDYAAKYAGIADRVVTNYGPEIATKYIDAANAYAADAKKSADVDKWTSYADNWIAKYGDESARVWLDRAKDFTEDQGSGNTGKFLDLANDYAAKYSGAQYADYAENVMNKGLEYAQTYGKADKWLKGVIGAADSYGAKFADDYVNYGMDYASEYDLKTSSAYLKNALGVAKSYGADYASKYLDIASAYTDKYGVKDASKYLKGYKKWTQAQYDEYVVGDVASAQAWVEKYSP